MNKRISMDRKKHGIFISHSHKDWALAGLIYDFFDNAGCAPFIDVQHINHGEYEPLLKWQVENSPYFLCVLTNNTFAKCDEENWSSWICKEIGWALKKKREIFLIATEGFEWPKMEMPEEIRKIKDYHIEFIGQANYLRTMETIASEKIDYEKIERVLDWKEKLNISHNTTVISRDEMEKDVCTKESRFGEKIVKAARENEEYKGKNKIKFIRMSCYAATTIFTPQRRMVDERAYDKEIMANIFKILLNDPEFSLEVVINAPDCDAASEAIKNERIGNSSLEAIPEATFYSSYFSFHASKPWQRVSLWLSLERINLPPRSFIYSNMGLDG